VAPCRASGTIRRLHSSCGTHDPLLVDLCPVFYLCDVMTRAHSFAAFPPSFYATFSGYGLMRRYLPESTVQFVSFDCKFSRSYICPRGAAVERTIIVPVIVVDN